MIRVSRSRFWIMVVERECYAFYPSIVTETHKVKLLFYMYDTDTAKYAASFTSYNY